jgi:hypothetical protein
VSMTKKAIPYRPKDMNQLAKYIVDLSTGSIDEKKELSTVKPVKKKKKKK